MVSSEGSYSSIGWGGILLLLNSLDRLIESVGHKRAHAVDVVCWAEASDGEVALCGYQSVYEFLELALRGNGVVVMAP